MTRPAPRDSSRFSISARYSRASSRARSVGLTVGERLDLHPERAADVGLAAAETRAVEALEDGHVSAGRQRARLDQLGDRADGGVLPADPRHEQEQPVALLGGGHGGLLVVAVDASVTVMPGRTTTSSS